MDLVYTAMKYAIRCHESTNHKYDGFPYFVHLSMVYGEAERYQNLVPESKRDVFLAAAWCHDVIEDTRETYNDVSSAVGKEVADLVYALTNEKGKNRRERANDKYYEGIRNTEFAGLLKICDRIANVKYSKMVKSGMFMKYKHENSDFIAKVDPDGKYSTAIRDLNDVFDTGYKFLISLES